MKKILLAVLCLFLAGCGTASVSKGDAVPLVGEVLQADMTAYSLEHGDYQIAAQKNEILLFRDGALCRFQDGVLTSQKTAPYPKDLVGSPLPQQDGELLSYCTQNGIWTMDPLSGSTRLLRQLSGGTPSLINLSEGLVQCRIEGETTRYLQLRMDNGAVLASQEEPFADGFSIQRFGNTDCLLMEHTMAALPWDWQLVGFLENSMEAVLYAGSRLILLDLKTGKGLQETTLDGISHPTCAVQTEDGSIWMMAQENSRPLLLRWDAEKSTPSSVSLDVTPYSTQESPDLSGLAECRALAQEIEAAYGFQVKLWEDARKVSPLDYEFTPEHLVPIIMHSLGTIESALSRFPEGFLNLLAADARETNLCLVRQIQGADGTAALETASGLQFWEGAGSYLVLCPGPDLERAVYHEIYHMMDSRILAKTHTYDHWDSLNPAGFSYGKTDTAFREAFVDRYAMTSPFEDRARILECAMTDGMDRLFQSRALQAKLKTVCTGIREAFYLTDSREKLPWEQYLQ